MDLNLDLKPMRQNSELQAQLEKVALQAIASAFAEFQGTEVAASVEARLAGASDEREIQTLFEKYPMHLPGFDLIYDRSPDFFSLLRARGEAHVVVTGGMKGSPELLGLGAVSIREGYIAGAKARVAYLGDLRVVPNRKTFRLWRTIYSRLIEEISRELGVETFLTAILGDNAMALRSLVERRNSDFLYESVGQVRMINVLGAWAPLPESRKLKDAGLVVTWGNDEAYREFVQTHSPRVRHGYTQPQESGLPLLVSDRDGQTVVALRLVSPDPMKRMRVANVSAAMQVAVQVARRMAGTAKDGSLSTAYLANQVFHSEASAVQRRLAIMQAVEACYREPVRELLKSRTMLVIPDSVGLGVRDLRGRLTASTRVQIFEVRSKNFTPSLDQSAPISVQNLGFEMALV